MLRWPRCARSASTAPPLTRSHDGRDATRRRSSTTSAPSSTCTWLPSRRSRSAAWRRSHRWFRTAGPRLGLVAAWTAVGAVVGIGLSAAFTPLLLLLVPAAAAAIGLSRGTGVGREACALLTGAGLLPLLLAWRNRGGPGEVCTTAADASTCTEVGNPWLWLAVGVVLVAGGLALALRRPQA